MEKVLFSEEQRFTQWWLWAILIFTLLAVFAPFANGIYLQEVLNAPPGDNPMTTEGLIVTGIASLLIVGIIFLLFVYAKLEIKITDKCIMVAFPPFVRKWKKFTPAEIANYKVRTYNPLRDYGGYGVKHGLRRGQAYTVSGRTGLQLYLKNGKRVLIGTQKKQAIEYAMGKLTGKENSVKNG